MQRPSTTGDHAGVRSPSASEDGARGSAAAGPTPWRDWSFRLLVAGIVLAPLATVSLSHQAALEAQAAAILGCTLAVGVLGLSGGRGTGVRPPLPSRVVVGATLYGIVALAAAANGLARGNDPSLAIGQLLSMGLLPLAVACGWLALPAANGRAFAWALTLATGLMILGIAAYQASDLFAGRYVRSLAVGDQVSPSGVGLLALLLALALLVASSGRQRAFHAGTLAAAALYVLFGNVRSLLLVTPIALFAFVAGASALRPLLRRRVFAPLVAVTLAALAVAAGAAGWWRAARPNMIPAIDSSAGFWQLPPSARVVLGGSGFEAGPALQWTTSTLQRALPISTPFSVEPGATYRFRASLVGDGTRHGYIAVIFLDDAGQVASRQSLKSRSEYVRLRFQRLVTAPPASARAQLEVGFDQHATGTWTAAGVSLERIAPAALARVCQYVSQLFRRLSAVAEITDESGVRDLSISARFKETNVVFGLFREAPIELRLLGHGLGAQFSTDPSLPADTNYIHNFYAFLLFKTGVIGTVLVLAALVLWAGSSLRCARRSTEPWAQAFHAAVFAAWVGYAIWSLACPEILDFRIAPLWGLLLASGGLPQPGPAESRST